MVEATIFGRLAMGERVDEAMFSDRWRVRLGGRPDGRLVHAEEFRLGPDIGAELQARPVADAACAVATVLLISGRPGNIWKQPGRSLERRAVPASGRLALQPN